MWPPVNRILVDEGHAQLQENGDNEFNSSVWWQEPISQGTKGNILIYKEKMQTPPKAAESSNAAAKSSILDMVSNAGQVSIGYRK